MSEVNSGFDENSIKLEVERQSKMLRLRVKDAINNQKNHVLRLFEDGFISESNKNTLICSVYSASVTISTLVEMFESANIQTEFQLKKYIMAINDAISSFNTGITEEINLTIENSKEDNITI